MSFTLNYHIYGIHCIYNFWINRVSLTMRQSCTCSSSLSIVIVYSVYRDFMTCTLYLWHTFLILKYTSQSHKIPPYKYPGIMFILLNHQNQYFQTSEIISYERLTFSKSFRAYIFYPTLPKKMNNKPSCLATTQP